MSKSALRVFAVLVSILGAASSFAQGNPQTINVPLSRPGEKVSLHVDIVSARIEVIGEDRKDAEISIDVAGGERRIVTPSGSKSLAGGSFEVQVEENDNTISVETDRPNDRVTVVARIPRRADLHLSTVNEGEIIVRDIVGDLQLENVNGPITATNIAGSVIAESVNEAIAVGLTGVADSAATALSSLNGDIHVTLPANAGVELRLDSQRGEIESEFELDVKPTKPLIERKETRDGVSVRLENVIVAAINGGGPVIQMKTLNGNIRISKATK